jgi:transposase
MNEVTTIGLDLAKNVFQVHGVDASGRAVVRRQLRRSQVLPFFERRAPCLVGIEACATSHHWAREIAKFGHEVRLMPARYVKPYVKRNKNDAADAEAICEAVTRPTMRFVEVKTEEQQSVLMLHRTRQLFVRQRTTLINAIRAHLAEFGIIAGIGRNGVERLLLLIDGGMDKRLPPAAEECLRALQTQLVLVKRQILEADRRILAWHRSNELSRRLEAIPGIGPLIATALVASIPDPYAFGPVIRRAKQVGYTRRPWLAELMMRRPVKVAAIALANKIARIAWALMVRGTHYREPVPQAA